MAINSSKQKDIFDYSLTGDEALRAVDNGLANAIWYQTPIDIDKMRDLLTRKNGPAIRDTALWFGLIFASAYLMYYWWGSWLAIIPCLIYSVLYASTSDSRWHESSHGTAFKTEWMNNTLYEIASFMVIRQSNVWRWSHTRHHSDTIVRGRDPEISIPRPPNIKNIILTFLGLGGSIPEFKRLWRHALGKIDEQVATYVPDNEHKNIFIVARIYLLIYFVVIVLAIYLHSFLPLMYVGIPTLVGSWLMPIYSFTQHAGLAENVLDHRLNCRTVYMSSVNRFLYWNMNYHVEHHMFPLVPYHALPKLHKLMKYDCPPPYTSIFNAFNEIIPALRKQIKDPAYFVERALPITEKINNQKSKTNFEGDIKEVINGRIFVCTIDKLAKTQLVRFDLLEKTYAIYRNAKGELFATDGICSHGKTHLSEGIIIDNMIECPKHNGRFHMSDGSPARKPVCEGIRTYKVELIDDKVLLSI